MQNKVLVGHRVFNRELVEDLAFVLKFSMNKRLPRFFYDPLLGLFRHLMMNWHAAVLDVSVLKHHRKLTEAKANNLICMA